VEVTESKGGFGGFAGYGGYGASRFDSMDFGSSYTTPGWQRAQRSGRSGSGGGQGGGRGVFGERPASFTRTADAAPRRAPLTIEGELVAKSTGVNSSYSVGDRVFHLKFGNGRVKDVDGNKLTILFDKAGEKRVVDSFVERI
ncbi:MAG: AAA family ATPase, partial [Alphaproteobacteria bacterium]